MVILMLLKSVTAEPEIDCPLVPLNTTVPVPRLNVPVFAKLPPTFKVAGPFSVPLMLILLKFVVPVIVVVPVNPTVPVLGVNVPLLDQLPPTLSVPGDALSVPVIVTLLKVLVLVEPDIVVAPPNVTVPDEEFNVPPLLIRFPLTLKLEVGVSVPVMVIPPKIGVVPPLIVVAPENVMALAVSNDAALLTRFPLRFKVWPFESNVPTLRVSAPLTMPGPAKVLVFVPEIVTLLNVCPPGVIDCVLPLN